MPVGVVILPRTAPPAIRNFGRWLGLLSEVCWQSGRHLTAKFSNLPGCRSLNPEGAAQAALQEQTCYTGYGVGLTLVRAQYK